MREVSGEGRSKAQITPAISDDLSRMAIMEMVGLDLFELGGSHYLVMVDKRRVLEGWFLQYGSQGC